MPKPSFEESYIENRRKKGIATTGWDFTNLLPGNASKMNKALSTLLTQDQRNALNRIKLKLQNK